MELDHLAVSGETLEAAVEHVESALGVRMQPGGKHALFGTWNRLLGLGEGLYLEAIAVDPVAPPPGRARWFGLDDFAGPARLTNWICRTHDIEAELATCTEKAGGAVAVSRGDLSWRITVPDDGQMPFDGAFPAFIEWEGTAHPSVTLSDSGCVLRQLTVASPDAAALSEIMRRRVTDPRIRIESGPVPEFLAEFDTPAGVRSLQ
ncbi:VOC family protein [Mesobacterium pallidum]|uniref:VOC family protein n=1 Tax=Mesobacterium pallidum TaxID=2872037 RepID=UPI001EE21E36|nr:VOC family protein [Mesobacterium pallidum]